MTNSPATAAKTVAPKTPKAKIVLTPGQVRAVKIFSNAKRAEAAAKARKERYEAVIREALGDVAELGITPEGLAVVEVMHSSNSKYDAETLKTRFPEAAAAAFRSTPYTYLKSI